MSPRAGPIALALILAGCPAEATSTLRVDVRAELQAGVEFDAVRTEVLTGDASGRFAELDADPSAPWLDGTRVAELDGLPRGPVTVRVSLLRGGTLVIQRPIRVELSVANEGVTAIFTRECLGVECPIEGGDPVAAACVGGACQSDGCTPENPDACEAETCTDPAADCAGGVACAVAECTADGACFHRPDGARCEPGQTCDPVEGCVGGGPTLCDPFPGSDLDLQTVEESNCVHSPDEPLRCWGANPIGFGEPFEPIPTPREVQPSLRFSLFALGGDHWCGVDTGGQLRCAGDDWAGQLGDGEPAGPTDAPVTLGPFGEAITALSAAFATSCASIGDETLCWGHNDAGQLGIGVISEEVWEPTALPRTFAQLEAGHFHSCGITDAGALFCWGDNANEQLAEPFGDLDNAPAPRQLAMAGVAQVSVGFEYTLMIDTDGVAWSWGANFLGQLGRPEAVGGGTPEGGAIDLPAAARQVEGGFHHACAITADGALYCWGESASGQLGPDAPAGDFTATPTRVLADRTVVDIGVGDGHTCALDDTGRVFCWGVNEDAQTGAPPSAGGPDPVQVCLD